MNSQIGNPKPQILVTGGGPAGSSLAIRLAISGFPVTLVERERFPRHKLCGEFISPECFRHFEELGLAPAMFDKGGDLTRETRFFSRRGMSVAVPTRWFGSGDFALSLSRAEMDFQLLTRAREVGVEVIEGARAVDAAVENERVVSVAVKHDDGKREEIAGDYFIDATGRANVLTKITTKKQWKKAPAKAALLGFKNHFAGVEMPKGVCEIYSFECGYGGLNHIEDGAANFCFLIKANTAKGFANDHAGLLDYVRSRNTRAAETLRNAERVRDWIAVSVDGFGIKPASPFLNLLSVGDSAAFIDPFTGSGMLMAFESAELLARCLHRHAAESRALHHIYRVEHRKLFGKRLFVSSALRRAAFVPTVASAVIGAVGLSSRFRELLAKSTRSRNDAIRTDR